MTAFPVSSFLDGHISGWVKWVPFLQPPGRQVGRELHRGRRGVEKR